MTISELVVVSVGRPTPKGTKPLILANMAGQFFSGWASAASKVEVGALVSASLLSWDAEHGVFWGYVS